MFAVGESVIDTRSNRVVLIVDVHELWGITTCKVIDMATNTVYSVNTENLASSGTASAASEAFVHFAAAWCKVKNELANGTVFDTSESVIPLPHQLYALERVMASNNVRYMMADEVGLGKTIEAGLVIKEMKTRGLIERVLVVCPIGLVTQWEAEMLEKFGERFTIVSPEDYATLKKINPDQNVFTQFPLVISPMDAIKPMEQRIGWTQERVDQYNDERIEAVVAGGWDLIIIDEAHRVAGSTGEVARHKLGDMLSKASPYLLLLTATPHSGKTEPFLRLMQLLDHDAFPNSKAVIREQVAPYIIRTEKREAVDNDGKSLFKERHTHLVKVEWQERHSLQQEIYKRVTEYVRTGYNKAIQEKKPYVGFLMVLFQRLVSSSTAAIANALERRLNILTTQSDQLHTASIGDLADQEMEESLEEALTVLSAGIAEEKKQLNQLLSLAKQAQLQFIDAKAEHLCEILRMLSAQEDDVKIIIFTEFVMTQKFIQALAEERGFTTALLNGQMSIEERNVALRRFRRERNILISTDAGGEGINIQFAHIVINYDLPWNPMKIEQRIGRADRIGQAKDVEVFNFILDDTVENRVRTVLEEKLATILSELGFDKLQDVLNSDSADLDFTQVYMKTIAAQKYGTYYTDELGKDMEKQVGQAVKIRDVIRDEKTLTPDSQFEKQQQAFHSVLRNMLSQYRAWKGYDTDSLFDIELSVSDPQIQILLGDKIVWHQKDGIPVFEVKGVNTEAGLWSLWRIALSDGDEDQRMISLFINDSGVYRPAASKLLWDEMLRDKISLNMCDSESLDDETYSAILARAAELTEDTFLTMKNQYYSQHEQEYKKRRYALTLRIEAAGKIGIDNIRVSRIGKLGRQLHELQQEYDRQRSICPSLQPMLICRVKKPC
jgi:superfamily II DNA or RNA helicase